LANVPPLWPDSNLRRRIAAQIVQTGQCLVVLDDDPTGSQTVYGIQVLTRMFFGAICSRDLTSASRRRTMPLETATLPHQGAGHIRIRFGRKARVPTAIAFTAAVLVSGWSVSDRRCPSEPQLQTARSPWWGAPLPACTI